MWIRVMLAVPLTIMLIAGSWRAATSLPQVGADRAGYYAWVQAWVTQGTLDPGVALSTWDSYHFRPKELNGRFLTPNKYPIGWSVAALPGVLVAQVLAVAGNRWGGMHVPMDGTGLWTIWWACMSILSLVIAGYISSYAALRELTGDLPAAAGLMLAWMGTSALAYTWWEPMMAHGVTSAFVGIALWAAVRKTSSTACTKWALLWGASSGMLIITRVVDAVILLPSVILLLAEADKESGVLRLPARPTTRLMTTVLAGGAGVAGPLLAQMGIWKIVYGQWWFRGYADEHFGWAPGHLLLVLVSSNHGLLFWHPIVAVAIVGSIVVAVRERGTTRMLAASVLVAAAAMVLVYACWHMWWLGWSYGARWATDLLPLWALGLAWFIQRFHGHRQAVHPMLAGFVLVSVVLLLGQFYGRLPMEGRLSVVPGTNGRVPLWWP